MYSLVLEAEIMRKYKSNENKLAFIQQYENFETKTSPAKLWPRTKWLVKHLLSRIFLSDC